MVTENAVKAINVDTAHAGGVRIRFHQQATYNNLIVVLDLMTRLNQKKYWLDTQHNLTTLYAITDEPLPPDSVHQQEFLCGNSLYEFPLPTETTSLKQLLASLWQQAWRPSALLLAVISVLNFYYLTRPRRLAR